MIVPSTTVAGEIVFEKSLGREVAIEIAQRLKTSLYGSCNHLEVQRAGDHGNYRIVLSYTVPHRETGSWAGFVPGYRPTLFTDDQLKRWVDDVLRKLRIMLGAKKDRRYFHGIPRGVKYWSITDDVTSLT